MKSFFDFCREIILDDTYKWAIIIGLFIIGGAIIDHYAKKDELAKLEIQVKVTSTPPVVENIKQ
jgi:hypothetical protein